MLNHCAIPAPLNIRVKLPIFPINNASGINKKCNKEFQSSHLGRFITKELLADKGAKGLSKISLEEWQNHLEKKPPAWELRELSEEQQKKFALRTKSFLIAATKHLVNKLPLKMQHSIAT